MVNRSQLLEAMAPFSTEAAELHAAVDGVVRWMEEPPFGPYHALVRGLVDAAKWDLLFDSFYRVLPFGTGGRRGPVGVGPNRMNPWSLGTSVQGNVDFLRERFGPDLPLRVVIAADVRIFRDLRGDFPPHLDNPLLGMRSVDLARDAAAIFVANGVEVFMLDPEGARFLATPELSFLIRQLGAQGGLNVSASHNPPDDSGGKFYTELGAQEVPPFDEQMVKKVEQVTAVPEASWEAALASGLVHFLDESHHEAYLEEVSSVLRGSDRGARLVFTNLHGVGDLTVGEALERAGFEVHYTPSQRAHDGGFPNVPFRAPNPEYPSAFEAALRCAEELDADLVLSTDPDADRIGAMVPDGRAGKPNWRFLTGNELSSLIAAARFEGAETGSVGIKTEVTTELFSRVVRAAGGQVVDHLLVGCKYIAGVMRDLEERGRSGAVTGGIHSVLIGTEESHGFLLSTNIRDKDAAAPALVLAELASREKARGSSLLAYLEDLYRAHGAVANVQMPLVMSGSVGRSRILAIQDSFRQSPPSTIGGLAVTEFADRRDEQGIFGPLVSETDAVSRDVLSFRLGPDHRVIIRPSGTEPKTKIYAEVSVPVDGDLDVALDRADAQAGSLALALVRLALERVGLSMDAVGLACSPLLGVDERIAFGRDVLPEAVARAEEGVSAEVLRAWAEHRFGSWGGGSGIALCASGYRAFRTQARREGRLNDSVCGVLDTLWPEG